MAGKNLPRVAYYWYKVSYEIETE